MHMSYWAAGFSASLWLTFSVFVHFAHRKEYKGPVREHAWLSLGACAALFGAVAASMYIAGWN